MKCILFVLCTALFHFANAQNISGTWQGNYNSFLGAIMRPQKLVVDLMITQDTNVSGSSHFYYSNGDYEHYRVTGIYHPDDSTIFFSEDSSLVLHKTKLTGSSAAFYLSLRKEMDICRIKMAAESMGSIPPCTALMIVSTKKNRYNVTISSNFGNNGTLELFLKN